MAKKLILYGMWVGKGRLRGLTWGAVLLCYSLLSPLYAGAEMCTTGIDYNKPTIAAGSYHAVGLKEDGTVVAVAYPWPGPQFGQVNVSGWTNIKAIAAGCYNTVGLKEDGTVVTAGYPWWDISGWTNIKAIAASCYDILGIKEDGTVVTTGGDNVSDWTNIKAIAIGHYFTEAGHTVGLKEDGTVVAVGNNSFGQLNVSDWTNIKAIAANSTANWGGETMVGHTVGLKEDGTVVATGGTNVSGWSNIKAIAAGIYGGTVGLREDGTGASNWSNITAIAVGPLHTLGLKEDGTVVAVGSFSDFLNVSDWTNIRQPACLNNAPIVNAGPDQVVECAGPSGASVILNGSASSDPDGDPLTYTWTWAGGSAEGATPTVTLPLGTTQVILTVNDGKTTATDTVNITVQDKTPPVTTATGGSGNWYNANIISTFSATDSCSGAKEVHYNVNGYETVIPGDSASLTLTADGIYSIAYYSIDNAGNAESPKSMTVKIDKTPPALNLSTNPNILWPPNHKMEGVLIGGSATDATSGISSVAFSVADEYGIVQPSISNFNTTIQLEAWREGTDMDGRHYTITAVAADAAGNKTTASTMILVPHDQGN